jgi:hypothetical protein
MNEFKRAVMVQTIGDSLASGQPLPRSWPIPSFVLAMPALLKGQFGDVAYAIYATLSEADQTSAREWSVCTHFPPLGTLPFLDLVPFPCDVTTAQVRTVGRGNGHLV